MAWPPVIPPVTRTNATPSLDTHPADHTEIAQALTDLVSKLDITPWAAMPALTAGWASFPGYPPALYRRALGWIEFQGLLNNGGTPAAGSIVFTMPVGFRPPGLVTTQTGPTRLDFDATGVCVYQGGGASIVAMNGVRYPLGGLGQ